MCISVHFAGGSRVYVLVSVFTPSSSFTFITVSIAFANVPAPRSTSSLALVVRGSGFFGPH